jgi:conjugal transfer mating pair stabilization protein TraG
MGRELSAKLGKTITRSDRAEANLRKQMEFSESVVGAYQRGESLSKDIAKDPRNLRMFEDMIRLEQAGSAAELIKMESYIGNIASIPHQLTKNSSLPQSFGDVENTHSQNIKSLGRDDVTSNFTKFKSTVQNTNLGGEAGRQTEQHPAETSRAPIKAAGERSDAAIKNAEKEFQERAGVEVGADGHIYTRRSLFGDANSQVKSDPDVVAEKAKELAEKLADVIRKEK